MLPEGQQEATGLDLKAGSAWLVQVGAKFPKGETKWMPRSYNEGEYAAFFKIK